MYTIYMYIYIHVYYIHAVDTHIQSQACIYTYTHTQMDRLCCRWHLRDLFIKNMAALNEIALSRAFRNEPLSKMLLKHSRSPPTTN